MHAWKAYVGTESRLHVLLTPAVDRGGWKAPLSAFTHEENLSRTFWTVGWTSPRAGLYSCDKRILKNIVDSNTVCLSP
jgi:hypothetical protein